ncbi:hypothetical protein [Paraburkholderia bryophila]|uniref:Uncharacterized protein n=1 Tax=Paraburkholderia bryophila TaxID=420952 RepID=A0A7Y9WG69_9BURK|nr:hypothetical protein [Paraburkholderia bryophila]NYH20279.1 hypothetical protein [Paraburkholderia bryophila]NYH20694.1 hypothetical protein [Paraburkholderia bryophila]
MNTASNTAAARATATATTRNNWLGKLRALALQALNIHLQTCAIMAEAHRRPQ